MLSEQFDDLLNSSNTIMGHTTKLIQCFTPPLTAGIYNITVTQEVAKQGTQVALAKNMSKSLSFAVDAARFTLNATDIYSVYPPSNQFGNYIGSLPHVVFSRRTLPWERTIDGLPPVFLRTETPENLRSPKVSPPIPWMALLLFTEEEMKQLHINRNVLTELIQPEKSGITRPEIFGRQDGESDKLRLMQWENESDGCFTIDIPKAQFLQQMPSLESLTYLAHAKEVNINNKDKEGITDINPEGTGVFSLIIGNRLPEKNKQHTAILVSLEGFTNYLKPSKDKAAAKNIPDGNSVRMAVLANWNFNNKGDMSFLQLVDGLEKKPLKIQAKSPETAAYFDAGYVGLEHLTRTGATTLSWYHGPLVPRLTPKTSRNMSFASSDAALRYDKKTGLFDISFAAAWQLGRMLALQNQGFSKAILNWRIKQKQAVISTSTTDVIDTLLNDKTTGSVKNKVIRYLDKNAVPLLSNDVIQPEPDNEVPRAIQNFLGNLYRLNGVPFSYLVPHEFYLEKQHGEFSGSLALFYVDPNWIEAMLDGALSIGRIQNTDTLLDTAMRGGFIPEFTGALQKSEQTSDKEQYQLNVTGFLLRSNLISGWRGIEIEAFDENNKPLSAFRLERVDNDIFLGIFNGNVASVVITQPYEGLHFGLKVGDDGSYLKNLKKEDGTNQVIHDGTADVSKELNKDFINNGVLNIAELAKKMKEKMGKIKWLGPDFTSSEFAYQMVDSPVKQQISIKVVVQ